MSKNNKLQRVRNPDTGVDGEQDRVLHVIARIQEAAVAVEISLPDDLDDLKQWVLQAEHTAAVQLARLGYAYMVLAEAMKGSFAGWLDDAGIPRQRAYECISVARRLTALPEPQRKVVATLPKSKLLAITALSDEDYAAAQEAGLLDRAADVRYTDLVAEIKALKASVTNERVRRETAERRLKQTQQTVTQAAERLKLSDWAHISRQESVAVAEELMLAIRHLREVYIEHLQSQSGVETVAHEALPAAGTMYHAVRSVLAETQMLLGLIAEDYPDAAQGLQIDHQLSAGEVAVARIGLDSILRRHQAQAKNRDAARGRDKKAREGGRGRNKKYVSED